MRRSASTISPPARQLTQVAKLIDVSKCIGCKACQVGVPGVERPARGGRLQPTASTTIRIDLTPDIVHGDALHRVGEPGDQNLEWLIRKDGCMHCEDPGCLKACPAPGAIVQYANGIVDFVTRTASAAATASRAARSTSRASRKVDHKAYKCTLCSDRVAVGQEPACAKACPTHAIVFGTKEDMMQHADERITDLKSRGFEMPASTIRRASAART